jgi:APA family basic amino acid/polyamine antiporter
LELKRQLGIGTAILIIIADVIGTGIFMTTGEALSITGNAGAVIALFAIGGLIALTGSLCYAELATMWPQDGGEYVYLQKIYGKIFSFLSGWVSLLIAFSLSAAMSAILAINYINKITNVPIFSDMTQPIAASLIIVFFSILHVIGVQKGSFVQNLFTIIKIIIVILFIVLGFIFADWSVAERLIQTYPTNSGESLLSYGSALIIIMYAYSGWNGSTYIAGEIKNPEKNLPKAMFFATLSIVLIYTAMNVVYLIASPGQEIIKDGMYTIGALTAKNLYGDTSGIIFNAAIVLILLSSVSVQMMIGPRVTYAMAKDRAIFSFLDRINPKFQTPDLSIIIQTALAVIYVFIGFDRILQMLIYMGFSLSIFPLLAVIGLVYMRIKRPEIERPFKVPFFPIVPAIYIILMLCVIITTLISKTKPSLYAIGILIIGVFISLIRESVFTNINK